MLAGCAAVLAQSQSAESTPESSRSNDLFVMSGPDFVRPGLAPKYRAGHTRQFNSGGSVFDDRHRIKQEDTNPRRLKTRS